MRKAAAGLALSILAALAAFYAPSIVVEEKSRAAVRIAGVAGVGVGLWLLIGSLPDAIEEFKGELAGGGGVFGAAGKLLFGQPTAGEVVSSQGTTNPASSLGAPKNIKGLVGAFTDPLDGGSVSRDLFSDTYTVKVAIANVGPAKVDSPVRVLVHEEQAIGPSGDQSADSAVQSFKPGATQQVLTLRVPVALNVTVPLEGINVTARLYVAGFLLDKITFTRD